MYIFWSVYRWKLAFNARQDTDTPQHDKHSQLHVYADNLSIVDFLAFLHGLCE